jgi:CHAT domain-containing protein
VRAARVAAVAFVAGAAIAGAACRGGAPARSPFATADSLRNEGRFAQMEPVYRALRDSFARAGDTAGQWRAELWWAEALLRNQRRDSVRVALAELTALANGDHRRAGWTGWRWCSFYSTQGKSDSAVSACTGAIALARETGDRELEAQAHDQLGTVQSRRGHYREALGESERAVGLWRSGGYPAGRLADLLNDLGVEYDNVGRLSDAERAYREGRDLALRGHNPRADFVLLSNLAGVRAETGDFSEAARLMETSLRAAAAYPDTGAMAYADNRLAEYFLAAGNFPAARRYLDSALALSERVVAYHRMATLLDLGTLELAAGSAAATARSLEAAEAFADRSDFGDERVFARTRLARLALRTGRVAEASSLADTAARIADSLGDIRAQLDAMLVRALVLEASRRAEAPGAYLRTLDAVESWRGRLAVGDLRMGLAESYWGAYEGAIRTLIAAGRAADAFAVAERARARRLLELMAERDASRGGSRHAELSNRLRERAQERDAVVDASEREALDREIADLADSLTAIEAGARARDPAAAARYPVPADLADLRAGLLGPGRTLLVWFWGDSAVYGWRVTPSTVRAARLGSSDSLGALVGFLRQTIGTPGRDSLWIGAARRAYAELVAPLGDDGSAQLLVIPDGPLSHVPLEVLVPPGGSQPWGLDRRFTYGPSASVLLALARAPRAGGWERAVLAVGNPAAGAASALAVSPADESDPLAPAGDGAVRGPDDPLAPLPYAEEEARAIRDLYRDAGADLLVGREATLARWEASRPARYRYLHFAAHAVVSDRQPERTGLVLADGDLDLGAIHRLALNSELVTLSACETALGRRVRGEGVIGLPHAFLAGGARGVVVTLWRVADRSTADFMREFYGELHAGQTPADGLLAVRRRWITAGGPRAHPYYWAPFVVIGAVAR